MRLNLARLAVLLLLISPTAAQAYLGPGAGFGAFGVLLGLAGSLVLGFFGIFWYPAKRLLRRLRRKPPPLLPTDPAETPESGE